MKSVFDAVIVGCGPAGMTAAIYLKRAKKNILLIEKSAPGGQLLKTNAIENYPGFLKISGVALSLKMLEQLNNLNIETHYGNILKIEKEKNTFKLETDVEEIYAKTVILATGRQPKLLGLKNEQKLIGRGISYCATCDGPLYKDKTVGVVGGGNTAVEEAMYLADICKKVYLFHRNENLRAEETNIEKLNKYENIEIILNSVVDTLFEKDNKLESVKTTDNEYYKLEGLFIFIGQIPNNEIYNNEQINLENGYITVNENMETSLAGVYACGDIIKKEYYQISTAVGEATIAALSAQKKINQTKF